MVAVGAYIGAAALDDNSFFTHLATGRYILEHGFPTSDVYSFTAPGRALGRAELAARRCCTPRSTGSSAWSGIRVLAAVLAGIAAGIMWTPHPPGPGPGRPRGASACSALVIAATMWAPRPLMVGLVLLGLTLLVAERRLPAPVLVPVFWLWVNMPRLVPARARRPRLLRRSGSRLDGERRPAELRPLMWAAVGTVLGAINPLGPVLLTFPVGPR